MGRYSDLASCKFIISNSSPLVFVVRFFFWERIIIYTFQLAEEFGKYFERLVEMLEQIGDNISRLFGYAGLFSGHTGLNDALSKVFISILKFCFGVRRLFRNEEKKRCGSPVRSWTLHS